MARIRSIKPEFFDSPGTAASSPEARLLFIAMWCLADDWGVGPANMKELAAFAFPNDEDLTSKELPCLCKEIASHYHVKFYNHRGRRYFAIPSWDEHQITQRRAKRRNPTPDDPESVPDKGFHPEPEPESNLSKEVPSVRKENSSTEQGNRGTGEQGNRPSSSQVADATHDQDETPREDVTRLCALLDAEMEANGTKANGHLKRNRDAARLLLDRDQYTEEQVADIIRWSQQDEFWRSNILSMSKLRAKFDQLKARRLADKKGGLKSAPTDPRLAKGYTPDTCQRCTGLLHPTEVRAGHDRCENCRQAA